MEIKFTILDNNFTKNKKNDINPINDSVDNNVIETNVINDMTTVAG